MKVEKKSGFVRVEDNDYTLEMFETGSVYIVDTYNQIVVIPIEQLKKMLYVAEIATDANPNTI